MSSAVEVLAGIAEKRIAAIRQKAFEPGRDTQHSNSYIREMAESQQAMAAEAVIKDVGSKWGAVLSEAGLGCSVILDREALGHLDGYPSSRDHNRDSAAVYCPETDLHRVLGAADKVSKENNRGVTVIQDYRPMYVLAQGEMVPLGYYTVRMYTLWQYPAR